MGKGKRAKDKKAAEILNAASESKKPSSVDIWTKALLVAVAVILVASMALIYVQSSGILLRAPNAYKTENFEITGAMMQYLVRTQFNTFYSNYYYYMNYFTLDLSKPLKDQKFGTSSIQNALLGEFDGTWFDYFWNQAETQAKQVLVYCEAALAKGIELDDEDYKHIDEAMDVIKEQAKANKYPSTKAYIYALYGEGIKKSDVRKMLEMSELAAKYYEIETERILDEITDEKVEEFFEKNKSDYYKADYIFIEFKAELLAAKEDEPTQEEIDLYLSDVKLAKEHAEKLAAMETIEEIEEYMIDFWFEQYYQSYYDSAFSDAVKKGSVKQDEKPTDEKIIEANKKLIYNAVIAAIAGDKKVEDLETLGDTKFDKDVLDATRNKLFTQINNKIDTMTKKIVAFGDTTDEENWVFAEDRKEGDSAVFNSDEKKEEDKKEETEGDKTEETTENKYETVTSRFYRIVKPRYVRDELTVEFGHILISGSSFEKEHNHEEGHTHTEEEEAELDKKAKDRADELLESFLNGEITKEAFEALAKDVTEDSGIFYDDVQPGDMVTEMDTWLFDENRKPGDAEVIKTEYGYHVTYFVGNCREIWFVESKNDLYTENVEKWYEDLEKATNIEKNNKIADRIDL